MSRIALGLEYDGTAFSGWQSQPDATGIQSLVESALSMVADHPVTVIAAGRTDAGVHASAQVIHFDSDAVRPERGWILGANTHLTPAVTVMWMRPVPDHFHARYGALARHYRYWILNQPRRPSLDRDRVCWIRQPLDPEPMQAAAQALVGRHDFSSFRSVQCQSRTPVRNLEKITVRQHGRYIVMDVVANAFLHHMVRNIAGVLIAIGKGDRPVQWAAEVLALRDRTRGGVTAVPQGLYLVGVRYEAGLNLPSESLIDLRDDTRL
jgi:tRNA pseudouridine38-40 synthase